MPVLDRLGFSNLVVFCLQFLLKLPAVGSILQCVRPDLLCVKGAFVQAPACSVVSDPVAHRQATCQTLQALLGMWRFKAPVELCDVHHCTE